MGHKAVVLGASGFAGTELLRLLAAHPGVDVAAAAASSFVGKSVSESYPSLAAYGDMKFVSVEEALEADSDIVFSSLPHTHSMKLFGEPEERKVVDIAGDFRLHDASLYPEWYGEPHRAPEALRNWVYGLTEYHRGEIIEANLVANPGCYPAAGILALGPLVAEGLIRTEFIHIDAKSGVSGAGRAGGEGFDFSAANENTRPYTVTGHKHIPEIEQELSRLSTKDLKVSFVPHLVPMTRGIVATCVGELSAKATTRDLIEGMNNHYSGEPFIKVLGEDSLPETKRLAGTNLAEVTARVDPRTNRAIAIAAIDNLGKGAAGQAVQNANLMLGYPETTALEQTGLVP